MTYKELVWIVDGTVHVKRFASDVNTTAIESMSLEEAEEYIDNNSLPCELWDRPADPPPTES